jgi:fermentation-respiration switch protein FrsA (DUF1100 family)
LAILLGVAYLAILALRFVWIDRILFPAPPSSYADDREILKLKTADGKSISAIYLPNPAARYTILYSHGNAEDLGRVRSQLYALHSLGFSVLGYDYHGYGTSEGTPNEENCYADVNAAYEYLTQTLHVPPERIIVLGRSVGGGPSVDLCARKACGGLILESAFTSAFRTTWIGCVVPGDRFRNLDKISKVRCPVLVMHGRDDMIVPFRHGQQLYAAAGEPKRCLWVEGAGHNDFTVRAAERYDQAILDFARLCQGIASPESRIASRTLMAWST